MPCNKEHTYRLDETKLASLEHHQKHGHGRHKCCQCAYNSGYKQGLQLSNSPTLAIDSLGTSQAQSDGRHRSVHQAFALGYKDGIERYILNQR